MLEILEPFLEQPNERGIEEAWFQQEGATAHTAGESQQHVVHITECFVPCLQ